MKDFIIKYYGRMRDYLLKANSEEEDVEGIAFEVEGLKEEYYNKTGENMASTDSEYKEQNAVWGLFRKFDRLYGENSNFVERDAKSLLAMNIWDNVFKPFATKENADLMRSIVNQ
ncbi:MAG: hypothetical protein J5965_28390 [Aeriscardovia sp.]|nr:hypothetical protein [Aeriscardovia sp.]MBP1531262.1 hypothetical protein [Bacteroidaceae bacterium]MBP1531538.1 hypothetical protein [Bacteroidaceae bacterium]